MNLIITYNRKREKQNEPTSKEKTTQKNRRTYESG